MLPYEVADNGDGTYTVTTQNTQIVVDEQALRDLTGSLENIETDLAGTRDLVTNGNLTRIRSMTFHLMPDIQFEQVDALNLKLGGFDDAIELRDAYRENFYKGKADQIERINHGYATGRQVSQEIMQNYLDEDGNVQADVNLVESQFANNNGINEYETQSADDLPPEDDESGDGPQH
jgi:hypothetical protein